MSTQHVWLKRVAKYFMIIYLNYVNDIYLNNTTTSIWSWYIQGPCFDNLGGCPARPPSFYACIQQSKYGGRQECKAESPGHPQISIYHCARLYQEPCTMFAHPETCIKSVSEYKLMGSILGLIVRIRRKSDSSFTSWKTPKTSIVDVWKN